MEWTPAKLRARAVSRSLFAPMTLRSAIERLGFVQADPIRAPARAQDLILRHRVAGYRAGDLERRYAALDIEEDYLYAYGFVSRPVWRLLHPRAARGLSALERRLLAWVRSDGPTHPGRLAPDFGAGRVRNAWGGQSKATTAALDALHSRGLLRIARRDAGVRIYDAVAAPQDPLPPDERLRHLVLIVARLLDPAIERSLVAIAAQLRRHLPGAADHRAPIRELVRRGELTRHTVDGQHYLSPAPEDEDGEAERRVRFLAPFDPLVFDRRRFEHLWRWPYRFEAYTPVAKRVRGYYAMPLLWGDAVVGWANTAVADGKLAVELGFAGARPRGREFRREVDAEVARLEEFLGR